MDRVSQRQAYFEVQAWVDGGRGVVVLSGDLDHSCVSRLADEFERLQAPACYRVVVDLRDLVSIDTAGVGVLLRAVKRASAGGGRVVLIGPRGSVAQKLRSMGLARVLPEVGSLDAAFAALAP